MRKIHVIVEPTKNAIKRSVGPDEDMSAFSEVKGEFPAALRYTKKDGSYPINALQINHPFFIRYYDEFPVFNDRDILGDEDFDVHVYGHAGDYLIIGSDGRRYVLSKECFENEYKIEVRSDNLMG